MYICIYVHIYRLDSTRLSSIVPSVSLRNAKKSGTDGIYRWPVPAKGAQGRASQEGEEASEVGPADSEPEARSTKHGPRTTTAPQPRRTPTSCQPASASSKTGLSRKVLLSSSWEFTMHLLKVRKVS